MTEQQQQPGNSMLAGQGDADGGRPEPLCIERLIVDYHAVIYSYAYRLTGRQPEAEDLTQQTFLVAQLKLDQIRDATKVVSWLLAVVRSCYFKMLRKPFPTAAANIEMEVDEIPDFIDDEPFDRDQLQIALNQLPDEFRLVVLAFYFEDCSYQEIAARLNVPVGTVMSRLSRAKARLRGSLLRADAPQNEKNATSKTGARLLFSQSDMRSPGGETLTRISHG